VREKMGFGVKKNPLCSFSSDVCINMPSIAQASLPLQYCRHTMELVDAPENPSPI